ncbi:universal stress protein [Rhizobium sp. TRM95111]|uniref:universal stress protein n=1 Tax=Rhizobium alarense TaxID=2846851 RepID=UPI001F401B90|nr:universal stress protein [Rhizobium alarense]MCF3638583.1 universal stress protein [Rhizobium alarense]
MYSKIIVPVAMDQMERAETTLRRAKTFSAPGGKIILLNVVEDVQSYMAIDFPADFLENEREFAVDRLTALRDKQGVDALVEVRYGSAAREINRAAEEHGADLVVIASHRPGISNYFLGATADRVVRHCPVSVLVDR